MRFSLNFVREFLKVDVSAKELAQRLTMAGMEVEHFAAQGNDEVFDIEVTANRYDWLSILGISREIASCFGQKLSVKYPRVVMSPICKEKKIIIEDKTDCSFYIGRAIRNIKVEESPKWLRERVSHCGHNAVNNIVDITNYCMLKWGNPLHAFDEDKINGDIYIRRARQNEVFVGIDDKERVLTKDNLVIADVEKVIALAGVIGAKNTAVSDSTKNIFLEAAVFSPLAVRRSRRRAGVDTESSYRFERRVSPEFLAYASAEAASLIEELGKGSFAGVLSAGRPPAQKRRRISISLSGLNSYLGASFPKAEVKKILSHLDFRVKGTSKDKLSVSAPLFRFDIDREVDVYEEVSRIYGYDKIEPCLPLLRNQIDNDKIYKFKAALRRQVSLLGLKEIITFSIDSEESLADLNQQGFIRLENPLRKQESVLRPTLLSAMVKSIGYNLNRHQSNLNFFEIADIYCKDKDKYKEEPVLAIGLSGSSEQFFRLKGIIHAISKFLNIEISFIDKGMPVFTNALRIVHCRQEIGFAAKLDNKVKDKLALKENIYFAQLDIAALAKLHKEKSYKPFSLYPIISRDISMALRKDVKFKEIEEVIKQNASGILSGVSVIDIYEAADSSKDCRMFTLRIFYQDRDKTLVASDVDDLHNSIREALSGKDGIILR